jgi:hypothetical protein
VEDHRAAIVRRRTFRCTAATSRIQKANVPHPREDARRPPRQTWEAKDGRPRGAVTEAPGRVGTVRIYRLRSGNNFQMGTKASFVSAARRVFADITSGRLRLFSSMTDSSTPFMQMMLVRRP